MQPDRFEVWSTGTESWSPVELELDDIDALQACYVKQAGGQYYEILRDQLGRWFRREVVYVSPMAIQQEW